jgi:hypothetical protein
MVKKQLAVVSLVGFLLLAGAGCMSSSEGESASIGDTVKSVQKELRGEGDKNASLSSSERERAISDAKKIATDIFGSGVKLNGQTTDNFIVKGGINIIYALPKKADASQQSAVERAFKSAGYDILDGEAPQTSGSEDEAYGGVVAEKGNIVFYFIYQHGGNQVSFMGMSSDQYAYVENTDENGETEK